MFIQTFERDKQTIIAFFCSRDILKLSWPKGSDSSMEQYTSYEPELINIDREIEMCKREYESLQIRRTEIISKMINVDMDLVLQNIVANELSANEVIGLIVEAAKAKQSKRINEYYSG